MEKDRIIKKDVSQQEAIDFFQQLSRTGFVLIFVSVIADSNNDLLKHRIISLHMW